MMVVLGVGSDRGIELNPADAAYLRVASLQGDYRIGPGERKRIQIGIEVIMTGNGGDPARGLHEIHEVKKALL